MMIDRLIAQIVEPVRVSVGTAIDPGLEAWIDWLDRERFWNAGLVVIRGLVLASVRDVGVCDAGAYDLVWDERQIVLRVSTESACRVYTGLVCESVGQDAFVSVGVDLARVADELLRGDRYDAFMYALESMLGAWPNAQALYQDCLRLEPVMRERILSVLERDVSALWHEYGVAIHPARGGVNPRWIDEWIAQRVALTWFGPATVQVRVHTRTHWIREAPVLSAGGDTVMGHRRIAETL